MVRPQCGAAVKVYLVFAIDQRHSEPCEPVVVEVLDNETSARTTRSAYVNRCVRVEEWEVGGTQGRVLFDDIGGS